MDKHWDKSDLISYLYGEMNPQEKNELEKALAENSDLRRELDGLQETREIMGMMGDKEVIEPEIDFGNEISSGRARKFPLRTWLAVAASITLIMIIGRLAGLSVVITKSQVALSWNETQQEKLLTREEMDQMIDAKIKEIQSKTESDVETRLDVFQNDIESRLVTFSKDNKKEITRLVNLENNRHQEELNLLAANLRDQNLQSIAEFIEVNNRQQQDDVKKMLVDFSDYLNQQRVEDLILIDTNLRNIKANSESKFEETGVILASIINTVNTQNN